MNDMTSYQILAHLFDKGYIKKEWSLLELNTLEAKAIEEMIKEESEGDKQRRRNYLIWIAELFHGNNHEAHLNSFMECPTVICGSLKQSLKELE